MSFYSCPKCDKEGVSKLRRWCLGPAVDTTCRECGVKIGVSWSGFVKWFVVPWSIGGAAAIASSPHWTGLAILAATLVSILPLYYKFAPPVIKE